jgi:hypothetical protein
VELLHCHAQLLGYTEREHHPVIGFKILF